MSIHRALAPAKVNLGLFLGPTRPHDLRHELVTVMQSISLADELTLEPAGGTDGTDGGDGRAARGGDAAGGGGSARGGDAGIADEVICPGVDGAAEENLALRALRAFRGATGWDASPQRLTIEKRIPVAAGLGGGSADAAAALRLARHASGLGDEGLLLRLAATLGADVPAQVSPGCWLATGAGENIERLADPGDAFALLILPFAGELSTAAVYDEADRLAIARSGERLDACLAVVREAWAHGTPRFTREGADRGQGADRGEGADAGAGAEAGAGGGELLRNDLQQPAVLLCPGILDGLTRARASGADWTFVSGSGPTVIGLFAGGLEGARERAELAGGGLAGLSRAPLWAEPVDEAFARARTDGARDSPLDTAVRHNPEQTRDE
jgi:4-diphosphocytidyl-2-C-methyl-D-erythritol kinase